MGISLNALFHGIEWLEKMKAVLVPVTDVMEVKRGERRGKNELFYPEEGHTIEPEYIRPVLKSPRQSERLYSPAGPARPSAAAGLKRSWQKEAIWAR